MYRKVILNSAPVNNVLIRLRAGKASAELALSPAKESNLKEPTMSFYAVIKKNARVALKGRWGVAIGIFALAFGVSVLLAWAEFMALRLFAPYPFYYQPPGDYAYYLRALLSYNPAELIITGVALLLYLLILAPLFLGITRWFYLLIQEEKATFTELFHFFESLRRYCKAVWYTVQITMRTLAWGIVFMILPAGVMSASIRFLRLEALSRQARSAASVGVILAFGLLLLASLLYAIYINKYALTPYLLCESDHVSVRQAFRTSIRYTKGYRGIKLLFTLSFIGWYLLSPFTLFLILLFVIPYHSAGAAVFARYLVEKNRYHEPQATREFGAAGFGRQTAGGTVTMPPVGGDF